MKEKIKLNYCVISVPPMLGGAEINGVNVVGETLCSKSFNRNRLKKFMHVGIDVTYMYTDFGGRDLSSF